MRYTTVAVSAILATSIAAAQPGAEPPIEPAPAPPDSALRPPVPPESAPPPAPGEFAPPATGPAFAQPAPSVDQGVLDDANSGRSWLMPTALTDPAGTWSFSDFELLAVGVGYSPTDQLSLSLTTLLPLTSDFPLILLGNAKYQVVKSGSLRVALQGAFFHFRETGSSGNSSATAGDLGAVATLCLDAGCHSHLSGFLAAGFAYQDQSAVPFLVAASVAVRVGRRVKLIVEADSAFITGAIDAAADGFLAFYGVRFTSRNIGVDLALARPFCSDCGDTGFVLGVPFVAFTYRSLRGD